MSRKQTSTDPFVNDLILELAEAKAERDAALKVVEAARVLKTYRETGVGVDHPRTLVEENSLAELETTLVAFNATRDSSTQEGS